MYHREKANTVYVCVNMHIPMYVYMCMCNLKNQGNKDPNHGQRHEYTIHQKSKKKKIDLKYTEKNNPTSLLVRQMQHKATLSCFSYQKF